FNGDGKPDLAVASMRSGDVFVLLDTTSDGATTPSFTSATPIPAGGSGHDNLAVGDFNGDGKPDLMVNDTYSSNLTVLLNTTPTGAVAPRFTSPILFGVGTNPYAVAVADFNGDGRPDLSASIEYSFNVEVL